MSSNSTVLDSTVNASAACRISAPVVTVTVRVPATASAPIVMLATAVVALLTVTELTSTSAPKLTVV